MSKATVSKKEWDYLVCPPEIAQAVLEKAGYDYKGCLIYQGSKAVNPYTEQRETVLTWTTVGYMLKDKKLINFEEDWQSVKAVKEFYNSINEGYMEMDLNEALEKLEKAGLIVEETTEQALARIAANSNEAIVEEIVEEIEKVRPVKNYYEVDPDDKGVTQQFELVMPNSTWEVQFSRSGFSWGGNVYPWRIIQNNNGGFTKVAHSMSGLRSVMRKIKEIQSEG